MRKRSSFYIDSFPDQHKLSISDYPTFSYLTSDAYSGINSNINANEFRNMSSKMNSYAEISSEPSPSPNFTSLMTTNPSINVVSNINNIISGNSPNKEEESINEITRLYDLNPEMFKNLRKISKSRF